VAVQDSNSSRPESLPFNTTGIDPDVAQAAFELIRRRPDLRSSILQSLNALRVAPRADAEDCLEDWDEEEGSISEAADCSIRNVPIYHGRYSELSMWDRRMLFGMRVKP
jgi:hypothetical protein